MEVRYRMNITEICNMALNHIGRERIADLDEDSEPARTCKIHYDMQRRVLLRNYTWSFARKYSKLSLLDTDTPGWNYTYAYPNDCVMARRLYNEDNTWQVLRRNFKGNMDQVLLNDNTKALVCNYEDACLEFTYDVKDCNLFTDDFAMALSYYLAAAIAIPLTGSQTMASSMQNLGAAYLSEARFTMSDERNRVPESPSKYFNSRR